MSTTHALPRTDDIVVPRTWALAHLAGACRRIIGLRYRVEVHGTDHLPPAGPVVVAANHVGFVDGPLLAIFSPRPVHVLTKTEMFNRRVTREFLLWSGQVPLIRQSIDQRAVRTALAVLRSGGCVGIFPEGGRGAGTAETARGGAAYLAMVTGAPVVPLAFLGTRDPGAGLDSVPPRGTRVVLRYGEPVVFERQEWPRTRAQVAQGTERVRVALSSLVAAATREYGIPGPGPLTTTEEDPA